nr:LLM class flavin-dependent oxidoreductase [Nocardia elegans]
MSPGIEIATGYKGEWPEFKERFARLRESVDLMRALWSGDRVDFEGQYYTTVGASIYDVPPAGIPVYIAAGGPVVARYAGRAGDGFICTSGKGMDLYTEKLMPAVTEGAEKVGRTLSDIDRMIEIKISYDTDPDLALENTRFWAPLSLTAEQKHSITDPIEMEAAADALPIEQIAERWIVFLHRGQLTAQQRAHVKVKFHRRRCRRFMMRHPIEDATEDSRKSRRGHWAPETGGDRRTRPALP